MDLRNLDPGHPDDRYWTWFHQSVMTRAVAELAIRREMARASVSDVLASWSRSLVPAALVAAGIATIMTLAAQRTSVELTEGPVAFDEVLVGEMGQQFVAADLFFAGDEDASSLMALVEMDHQ